MTDHYDGGDWWQAGLPLQIIAKHFRLPKLRKVQVKNVFFTPNFSQMRHLPNYSSPVDDLRFLKCCPHMSNSVLAAFLRSNKHLKRFLIDFIATADLTAPDPGVFEPALSEHKETIEELAVATSGDLGMIFWNLGSFSQWSSLKRLAVPDYMIRSILPSTRNLHEILPPLLEELQIEHATGHNNPMRRLLAPTVLAPWSATFQTMIHEAREKDITNIRRLAENKNVYVPYLKCVIWCYQKPTHSTSEYPEYPIDRKLAGLIGIFLAFEKVGVKFI